MTLFQTQMYQLSVSYIKKQLSIYASASGHSSGAIGMAQYSKSIIAVQKRRSAVAYTILAMDGGGVRGVLTARILEHIADPANCPKFTDNRELIKNACLLAGTSAGAINAALLAHPNGYTLAQVVGFYQHNAHLTCDPSFWHEAGHTWGLLRAKYGTQPRFDALQNLLGNTTLAELSNKVLIPTFQLNSANSISPSAEPTTLPAEPATWKSKFFHNFLLDNDGSSNAKDLRQSAVDVVMRSSATPTYFPIYQGFVDGGVAANNPSVCALAHALNVNTGNQQFEDIRLLSIGTGGKHHGPLKTVDGDWGLEPWGFTLVSLLVDATALMADYQCQQHLPPSQYCRIQIDLPSPVDLG